MTLLQQHSDKVNEVAELWQELMPSMSCPDRPQLLLWVSTYPLAVVQRGITRAAAKVRRMQDTFPMTANDAARYSSSVMRNAFAGRQESNPLREVYDSK